jgi:cytochrome c biogenesis protein CcmG, thiol:disulfide interchange protein DsbE
LSGTLERSDDAEPNTPADAAPNGAEPSPERPLRRHSDHTFRIISIAGIFVLVGFVTYAIVSGGSHRPAAKAFPATKPSSLADGATAPSFTLPRLGGGAPVSGATAAGKPMMINFFASWCPDCRAELKAVATLASRTAKKVAVIGIDTSDRTPADAQKLLSAVGATYPVGIDPTAKLAQQYRITGLPVTYFVNSHDRVVGVAFGAQTDKSLRRWIRRLSSEGTGG